MIHFHKMTVLEVIKNFEGKVSNFDLKEEISNLENYLNVSYNYLNSFMSHFNFKKNIKICKNWKMRTLS